MNIGDRKGRKMEKSTKDTNTPNMSVYYDIYCERNPFKWIRRYFRQRKWARQRAVRGYADCDILDISGWFLRILPSMLDQIAEEAHGYPVYFGNSFMAGNTTVPSSNGEEETETNFKAWKALLHLIAQKFRDADEDTCSLKNPYDDEWSQAYDRFTEEYGIFGEKLEKEALQRKDPSIQMHFPNEFPQWKDIMDKHREKEVEIVRFRQKSLDEAMELFHKWFWKL